MEGYLRTGADLVSAVDRVEESLSGQAPSNEPAMSTAAENDAALADLQKMMAGL